MNPCKKCGCVERYKNRACRDCALKKTAERYIENKEKINLYHAELHKSRKNDPVYMKKLAEKSAMYRQKNPHVTTVNNAKRRAANPELSRQQSRTWFANNKNKRVIYEQNRRAKKRASGEHLSVGLPDKLFTLQRGRCACCGVSIKGGFHLDHRMPLSLGGLHNDLNIQLLCQTCNQQKHAKHPIDFMQSRGFLL